MTDHSLDSFATRSELELSGRKLSYFSLPKFEQSSGVSLSELPYSLKILLENLLRREDGRSVEREEILGLARSGSKGAARNEIAFYPARVLLQDFTGVPAVVDLAVMRDAMAKMGG